MTTILQALDDPQLLAPRFRNWHGDAWRAFLSALFALPMTEAQLETFRACTGRQDAPTAPAREAWVPVGRRGGKSRMAALVAVYLAAFRDYSGILAAGEVGTLPVVAADRRQARVVFGHITGLLDETPMLAQLVVHRTAESIELSTRVRIEIHTASWRALRGYTVVGAVLDEVAFWRSDDSANPDREIVNALRPAMATVPDALLVAISSPYARRGVLWDMHRRHYGQDGDVLVWQAPTRVMNPTVPQAHVDRELAADEASARAEYLAEFRSDLEAFVSREVLEAVTVRGRHELPPRPGVEYVAFVDPSGGAQDAFTLAIAHTEQRSGAAVPLAVLDVVAEHRPPFSPEAVVADFAAILARYGVSRVMGDHYAGAWPREAFARHGITYEPSASPKSGLYLEFLPVLTSRRGELLDVPRLQAQFLALERRTSRGGRDSIDHPPQGHDDVSNAVAGAVTLAGAPVTTSMLFLDTEGGRPKPYDDVDQVKERLPHYFAGQPTDDSETCGTCAAFEGGKCTLRLFAVEATMPACEFYDPVPEGEEEDW